jgi:lipoate-protein ligase A
MPERTLRVLDWGSQAPLRSQTLWHAAAYGVSRGQPATLGFVRPSKPYVSIGYHRRLDEVDLDACASRRLAVFRRMIGGGPVYLDRDQLFFQIALPADEVRLPGAAAIRELLAPAVAAFRDAGVDAVFDEQGDISTPEGGKISGIGGGRIEDACIAVGNLIEDFDHAAMAAVLATDEPLLRDEALRLMRRFVVPTPVDEPAFKDALVQRYADAFELEPRTAGLSAFEEERLAELDVRFEDSAWLAGPDRPAPAARQVKIRAGVWVFASEAGGARVVGSVIGDRLERVWVRDPGANGGGAALERALVGATLADAATLAGGHGALGGRVAAALRRCDGRTL